MLSACHPLHGWRRGDRCADDQGVHDDVEFHQTRSTPGHLSETSVVDVIRADEDNLETCYRWTADAEAGAREATLHFLINSRGRVESFHLDSDETQAAELSCCLQTSAQSWVFPAPSDGDVAVSYPYLFRGDSEGPGLPGHDSAREREDAIQRVQFR